MLDFHASAMVLSDRQQTGRCGGQLPQELRPTNCLQAWEIQCATSAYLQATLGVTIAGWKCGLPTGDKIVIAPIYSNNVFAQQHNAASCQLFPRVTKTADEQIQVAAVEPEFAFVFRHPLIAQSTPYSINEIDQAVVSHLALELIGDRFSAPETVSFPELLADRLFNQGVYLGPPTTTTPESLNLQWHLANPQQQPVVHRYAGVHPGGGPKGPLYWLVNFLRERGINLYPGQIVITGSLAGVWKLPMATPIHIEYEHCGEFSVNFSPRA